MQNIAEIPAELKEIYKTVWEIKMRTIIDMAAERSTFIAWRTSPGKGLAVPYRCGQCGRPPTGRGKVRRTIFVRLVAPARLWTIHWNVSRLSLSKLLRPRNQQDSQD